MYIIYIYFFFIKLGNLFVDKCLWGGSGCRAGLALGTSCRKASNSIL